MDTDFTTGVPDISKIQDNTITAIELPYQVSREYMRKASDIKYEKGFVFKYTKREIIPEFRIIFNGKNFNVKDVIDLPDNYYIAYCVAMLDENIT